MDILLVHGELCLVVVMRILRGAVEVIIYAKLMELPNILRWGNMFSITRGLEVYFWLFFS